LMFRPIGLTLREDIPALLRLWCPNYLSAYSPPELGGDALA
jgi:hypothetical protein